MISSPFLFLWEIWSEITLLNIIAVVQFQQIIPSHALWMGSLIRTVKLSSPNVPACARVKTGVTDV